jgi:hypothetical protein
MYIVNNLESFVINFDRTTSVTRNTGWRRETGKFEVDVGSPVDVQ